VSTNDTPLVGSTVHDPPLGTRLIANDTLAEDEYAEESRFCTVTTNVYVTPGCITNGRMTKFEELDDDNNDEDEFDMSIPLDGHDHCNEYAGSGTPDAADDTNALNET
jgi:hypothetical protein